MTLQTSIVPKCRSFLLSSITLALLSIVFAYIFISFLILHQLLLNKTASATTCFIFSMYINLVLPICDFIFCNVLFFSLFFFSTDLFLPVIRNRSRGQCAYVEQKVLLFAWTFFFRFSFLTDSNTLRNKYQRGLRAVIIS